MANTKPRITILHYTALPVIGGVENVIAEHARLLAQAGYPVTLVTGRGGDNAKSILIPELDSEHPQNLQIARALDEGLVLSEFASLQEVIEKKLQPILADTDILIVHNVMNFHFNLPLTAALYQSLDYDSQPTLIAWCHDISRYVNPHSGVAPRYGFPWDLVRTCRREIRYVAVSPRRQKWLADTMDCPAEVIRVIPNGIAPEVLWGLDELGQKILKEFDLLNADLILLMPIRITRAKNIEFALRVTAALKLSGVMAKLIVTGPPDQHVTDSTNYFHELLALRHELQIDQDAIFLHEKNFSLGLPAVAELYRMCDLVLMPSLREGFGLPVLEGGLMGKPIFATNVPVVEQVGDDSVYLIAPDEPADQVAARIQKWSEETSEHRLRQRVRQRFTWSQIFAREIEPLIAEAQI